MKKAGMKNSTLNMSPESYFGYLALTRSDTGHQLPSVMRIIDYADEFKELVGIDVSEEDTSSPSQYCLPPEALLVFVHPLEEEAYWENPDAFLAKSTNSTNQDKMERPHITAGKAPIRTRSRYKPLPS